MARQRKIADTHKEQFCRLLETGMSVAESARGAGFSVNAFRGARSADPAFAQAWDEAYDAGGEVIDEEVRRRAIEGTEEPIVFMGRVIGTTRKYSDTILIFYAKSRRPLRYCDKARMAVLQRAWLKEDMQEGGPLDPEALRDLSTRLENAANAKALQAPEGTLASAADK